jgi:cell division protein FtsN
MAIDPVDTDLIDADVEDVDTDTADVTPTRPVRRRMLPVIILSVLLGALAGGAVVFLGLMKPPSSPLPPQASPSVPAGVPAPAANGSQASAGSEWTSTLSAAKQDIAAGRLREAQEEYLSILLIEPTHEDAMRGLVRVVGLIAKGDPAALRRQAEEYRRAIALGMETEEHYTAPAMELLARASLQAAPAGAEAPTSAPEGPRITRPPAASRPAPNPPPVTSPAQPKPPRPAPTPPPSRPQRPSPATPPPSARPPAAARPAPSAAQPAPPPPAALNVNEPFVTVVIGPFGSSERASAVTGELTISGYAARVRRQGEGSYLITLGPYRKSEAERAAAFVKSRFGANVPVALSPVP